MTEAPMRDADAEPGTDRVLVVMPTFDERDNLEAIHARLRAAAPSVDLLVVDDDSPDGTGMIADRLARDDPRTHVLHRAGKQGLGTAYLEGFGWGLDRGFDVLVEMDADGSHQPEQLSRLLAALDGADVVIGSRWVDGGRVEGRSLLRTVISKGGTRYARTLLGLPVRDVTGGYRAFSAAALRRLDLATVESRGYCFQMDMIRRIHRRGLRVREVPITLIERQRGRSKMSGAVFAESLLRVSRWGLRDRLDRLAGRTAP